MFLQVPIVKCVDVLVISQDWTGVACALERCVAGRRVLAAFTGAAAEVFSEAGALLRLREAGVEIGLEMCPVSSLPNKAGWVFLSHSGYIAVRAAEVVDTRTDVERGGLEVAGHTVAEFLGADESVAWRYLSPRYLSGFPQVSVSLAERVVCVSATGVIVIGAGGAGCAAALSARHAGAEVLCVEIRRSASCAEFPQLEAAGVAVRRGLRLGGVLRNGRQITGALFWDQTGRATLVRSQVVIDATGKALVAMAAGASVSQVLADDSAGYGGWGATLGYVHLPSCLDGLPVCSGDGADASEAQLHRVLRGETGKFPASEGCRVVGDIVLQPQDILLSRHYGDTVAVMHGGLGNGGTGLHSLLLALNNQEDTWETWIPLRALLPRKLSGLMTIGYGISMHWDALSVLRDSEGRRRLGVAAGLVAGAAVRLGCPLREVPLRPIQERLVVDGLLPKAALEVRSDENAAVLTPQRRLLYQAAAIFQRPDRARRQLQAAFEREPTVLVAEMLAFLGDSSGRELLKCFLDRTNWEAENVAPHLAPEHAILALQVIGGGAAALLRKLRELPLKASFRQLRAICLYLQRWPLPEAVPQLQRFLDAPGFAGHAAVEAGDTEAQLKELYVAGALQACAPGSGLALRSLNAYRASPRLILALYAAKLLSKYTK